MLLGKVKARGRPIKVEVSQRLICRRQTKEIVDRPYYVSNSSFLFIKLPSTLQILHPYFQTSLFSCISLFQQWCTLPTFSGKWEDRACSFYSYTEQKVEFDSENRLAFTFCYWEHILYQKYRFYNFKMHVHNIQIRAQTSKLFTNIFWNM